MSAKTILVVEDDPDLKEIISLKLSQEGFNVVKTDSGQEALDKIEGSLPDCVILDVMLPDIDGLTVLNEIATHSKTKDLPVIIFSNLTDTSLYNQVGAIGKYECLEKAKTDLSLLVEKIKEKFVD